MLEAECAGIKQAGKAWNHGVLGVATILERHGVSEFEETPALLMPRYTGHSFDSLEPHRKREPFPKLLPALWSALCACPHGDLDEGSIFMDQDGGFFRLIDPGVMTITNSYTRGEEQLREEHFLTNVVHYPVLMPQFGPRVHRAWRGGLAEQLGTVDRSSESETDGDQRVQQNRPAAPDLLALGIMYLRILTGTEFGRMIDRPAPFWTYAIKDYRPLDRSDYARLQGTLDSGLLDYLTTNQAHTPDASERERVLCRRLLALDFADRGELLKCI